MRAALPLAIALVAVLAAPASADTDEATQLLGDATHALTQVETVRADIEQEIDQLGIKKRMSGSYVAARGQFRITYDEPRSQTVVHDGEQLHWYIPGTHTVWRSEPRPSRPSDLAFRPGNPEALLGDAYTWEAFRSRKLWGLLGDEVRYVLTPTEPNGELSRLEVIVDVKQRVITRLDLYDTTDKLSAQQHFTGYRDFGKKGKFPSEVSVSFWTPAGTVRSTTRYQSLVVNEPVEDAVFELELPEGTTEQTLQGFAP